MKDTKVASVQFEHAPGDKQANLDKVRHFIAEAAEQGVELVVFPEMCVTGYWFLRDLSREQLLALAEPVPGGPTTGELLRLAKRHNLSLGAGLLEISDEGEMFNSYVVAMPDGRLRVRLGATFGSATGAAVSVPALTAAANAASCSGVNEAASARSCVVVISTLSALSGLRVCARVCTSEPGQSTLTPSNAGAVPKWLGK